MGACTKLSIALMHKVQGHLDSAMELMEQARGMYERTYGRQHPYVANAIYGLACIDCLAGRVPEALQHMEQAVAAGLSDYNSNQHIPTNHDLDVIREEARFKALFPQ